MAIDSVEICEYFLDDLLTVQELEMISQRLNIAICLDKKKSYKEIAKITGASSVTIGRVKQSFDYGEGGYRYILDRLNTNGEL